MQGLMQTPTRVWAPEAASLARLGGCLEPPVQGRSFRAGSHMSLSSHSFCSKAIPWGLHSVYITQLSERLSLLLLPLNEWFIKVMWFGTKFIVWLCWVFELCYPQIIHESPIDLPMRLLTVPRPLISFRYIKSGCTNQRGYGLFTMLIKKCYVALNAF